MALTPLLLVVIAAICHATWNLMAKRAADAGAAFVFAYNLICCVAFAPWALWALHAGAPLSPAALACLLASGMIHLAYSLALQRGYQVADLSVVYPVARGTGPLLSSIGAFAVLRETPTLPGLCGLAAVVAGIALITTQGRLDAFRRAGGAKGLVWGLITGALIAAYTLVDGYGVKILLIAPIVLDWSSNLLRFLLLAPVVAADAAGARARMRGRWGLAAGVGILSSLGYILILVALQDGAQLSRVAPAREMSMMIGALLGMIILKEPVGPARLGGCALLIAGVVLLGLA